MTDLLVRFDNNNNSGMFLLDYIKYSILKIVNAYNMK